jgi:hypothetical protein
MSAKQREQKITYPEWRSQRKVKNRCIIYPNDTLKQNWDIVIILFATYNSFFIPFDVSFRPLVFRSRLFKYIDIFIDSVFFVDILITFRAVFVSDTGVEVTSSKIIALNYLSGIFWIDLCATLPLDTIL